MTLFGEPECRVTVMGKQILLDGWHFADARDPTAARVLAMSLVYLGMPDRHVPADHRAEIEGMLA